MTILILNNNQIVDLKPLSSLIKLTELFLSNNPRLTDKICSVKPESICRFLPLQSGLNSGSSNGDLVSGKQGYQVTPLSSNP
ncbi:MAG: leucine-rich repeat domain-containing protein [Tolypothrix sp. T3-bin4]|nr:leucine-rich repeat domain-containing protein [Tolypothrix sp. T3-bin4]